MSAITPPGQVRVRFCPSPTGTPHVGLIRTALFNWAYARHTGGVLVFRIEDTDAARDSEESYHQLIDAMRWLGLDWDEGVEVGGPDGPYRQSQRSDVYADLLAKLVAGGHVYESFATPEEVEARHRAAGRDPKMGYDNADRDLTEEQRAAYRAQGREPVLRLRMPDEPISFTDLVRGEITFGSGSVPDFVVARAGGQPLYTLTNPVDDALMRITHVLRGEDLLSSTPRQIALYRALVEIGVTDRVPLFGHLPFVMGEGNRKLSKRDPQSDLFQHRRRGFIREGMVNYLALLGWSIAEDRDIFSPEELVAAFDVADVNANPARFDQTKAEAINADHIRLLDPADFTSRLVPYLVTDGVLPGQPSADQLGVLAAAAPLIQTRIQLLGEASGMVGFLFTADADLTIEDDALAAVAKDGQAGTILEVAHTTLGALGEWTAAGIEAALRQAIVEGMGVKPKLAFTPLRVAVTGRRVSPPLFESMEILGSTSTLSRLSALRARLAEAPDVVLLDLDDTLLDTRGAFRSAILATLQRWMPGLSTEEREAAVVHWATDPGGYFRQYTRSELTMEQQRRARVIDLHHAFGTPVPDEPGIADWISGYEAVFRSAWSLLPGAVDLLDRLDDAGVRIGAVTNAARRYQTDKLAAVGLTHRIPLLSCIDDTGIGKPDPGMWLRACAALEVAPQRAAYLGDELDVDARAAQDAGLIGVWFDRHGTGLTPSDVLVVRSLPEVPAVLGLGVPGAGPRAAPP